jgi:hypothetical protein
MGEQIGRYGGFAVLRDAAVFESAVARPSDIWRRIHAHVRSGDGSSV